MTPQLYDSIPFFDKLNDFIPILSISSNILIIATTLIICLLSVLFGIVYSKLRHKDIIHFAEPMICCMIILCMILIPGFNVNLSIYKSKLDKQELVQEILAHHDYQLILPVSVTSLNQLKGTLSIIPQEKDKQEVAGHTVIITEPKLSVTLDYDELMQITNHLKPNMRSNLYALTK